MKKYSEKIMHVVFLLAACASILAVILICAFLFVNGIPTIGKIGLGNFVLGKIWMPKSGIFGIFPMIIGSIYVTAGAILVGVPVGILAAIYMAKFCNEKVYKIVKPAVDLLAGIPSVVYGFIGLQVVVPFVRLIFGGTGFGILSGTFVLFVMILPTVTFMTTDTLRAVPRHYREASLAMGATRWQTIWRVTLNAAKPGIFTAVIFGMARAFGEALAIQMVVGNSAVIPTSLTTPAATLTSVLTMGIGNTVMGTVSNNVLWSLALVLLLMSLGFNMLVKFITRERKRNYER